MKSLFMSLGFAALGLLLIAAAPKNTATAASSSAAPGMSESP